MKAVVAVSLNDVIGIDSQVPWHISEDLKFFQKITGRNVIVMGNKTYESIPGNFLKGRINVVMSKNLILSPDINVVSLDYTYPIDEIINALESYKNFQWSHDIFVIGGVKVFEMFFPYIEEVYITIVQKNIPEEGDVIKYKFDFSCFEVVKEWPPMNENGLDYVRYLYKRNLTFLSTGEQR